jgi:hypothetical protein
VVAVAYSRPDPWVTPGDRSARPVPVRSARPARPARLGARVYRRRRAVALLAFAAIALMAATVTRMALAGSGGGALTASGSSGAAAASPTANHVYVVQPGDTLWSIVLATMHHGDPRPEVDNLALQLHGQPLLPGQRIRLP